MSNETRTPAFQTSPQGHLMGPVSAPTVPTSTSGQLLALAPSLQNSAALEHYRLSQLYQYAMAAERLRCPPGGGGFLPPLPPGLRPELAPFLYGPYCRLDPRLALCRPPEEPKPQQSYIGLIAMAILGAPDKKLVLSDIYQYILDNYPYFRSRGPGWRNSIRHNLSLNDCFVKAGRSANGKGHYWAVHPANVDDFSRGDFRRRKAQRKVRRAMGLAVDDEDSPSPPPSPTPPWTHALHGHPPMPPAMAAAAAAAAAAHHLQQQQQHHGVLPLALHSPADLSSSSEALLFRNHVHHHGHHQLLSTVHQSKTNNGIRRTFDVASLLAPETAEKKAEQEEEHIKKAKLDPEEEEEERAADVESDTDEISSSSQPADQQQQQRKRFRKKQQVLIRASAADQDEESSRDSIESEYRERHHHRHTHQHLQQEDSKSPRASDEEEIRVHSPKESSSPAGGHHQQLLMSNPGSMSPAEFFASSPFMTFHHHQHQQQQQQQQYGTANAQLPPPPNLLNLSPAQHHQLLQHNPSLASLMMLSSKYREITANMAKRH